MKSAIGHKSVSRLLGAEPRRARVRSRIAAVLGALLCLFAARAQALIDLRAVSVSGPAAASVGVDFLVTNVTAVEGSGENTLGWSIGYFLSTDPIITTSDTFIGNWSGYGALAGTIRTNYTTVKPPVTLPPGTYYLGAIADVFANYIEISETNNTVTGLPVLIYWGADLAPGSLSLRTNLFPGVGYWVTNVVSNLGSDGAGAFNVHTFFSTDAIISAQDVFLGTTYLTSLAGATSVTNVQWINIPTDTPGGSYFVGVIVDYFNNWPESNEANNVSVGLPVTVTEDLDLISPGFSGPAVASIQSSFVLTNVIRNLSAGSAASPVSVRIFRSTSPAVTTNDLTITDYNVGTLAPDTTQELFITINTAGLAPGTHYYAAFVDYGNAVNEVNETNNFSPIIAIATMAGLDFTMSAAGAAREAISGGFIFVTNVVVNQSPFEARSLDVGIYLSTDPIITTADTRIGTVNHYFIAGGQTISNVSAFIVPTTLAGNIYYLGVIADYPNAFTESDESNNSLYAHPLTLLRPWDLVVPVFSAPTSVDINALLRCTNVVQNAGTFATPSPCSVGCYLSSDAVITTNDTLLGTASVPVLAAGARFTNTFSFALNGITPGNYYLGTIADQTNRIREDNESNNASAALPLNLRLGVDLAPISFASTTNWTNHAFITFSHWIENRGVDAAPPSSVAYYLSADAVITTNDLLIANGAPPALAAGGTWRDDKGFSLRSDIAAGLYYLGAVVDDANAIPEANELNNSLAGPRVRVNVVSDLALLAFHAPSETAGGVPILITNEVQSFGGAAGETAHFGYYLSADPIITTDDVAIGSQLVNLPAGAQTGSYLFSLTVSNDIPPGNYFIGSILDHRGEVAETNEANNALPGQPILITGTSVVSIAGVDLAPIMVTATSLVSIGASLPITITVTNRGSAPVQGVVEAGVFLSADANITTNDVFLGTLTLTNLAGGEAKSITGRVAIASTAAAGLYYLGTVFDWRNAIAETNESNNALAGPAVEVRLGLDVEARWVTGPSMASPGQMVHLANWFYILRPEFPGLPLTLGFYLSSDPMITTNDHKLGEASFLPFVAGAYGIIVPDFAVPAGISTGTYWFGLIMDPDNVLPEINETNNSVTGNSVMIVIPEIIDLTRLRLIGTNVFVAFRTMPGRYYALESTTTLDATAPWMQVPGAGAVLGTGDEVEVPDPAGLNGSQRFYRVRLIP